MEKEKWEKEKDISLKTLFGRNFVSFPTLPIDNKWKFFRSKISTYPFLKNLRTPPRKSPLFTVKKSKIQRCSESGEGDERGKNSGEKIRFADEVV